MLLARLLKQRDRRCSTAYSVCKRHGCTRSMRCRVKRPIGALWSFLDYGLTVDSREEHIAFFPDHAERVAAALPKCPMRSLTRPMARARMTAMVRVPYG